MVRKLLGHIIGLSSADVEQVDKLLKIIIVTQSPHHLKYVLTIICRHGYEVELCQSISSR